MLKKLKIFGVLAMLLLGAAGCGSSSTGTNSNQKVVLNFWGTFETSQNIRPFIDAYQQKNPNVLINYTEKDYATYETDLLNAMAVGQAPDLFMINSDWLPKYQDKLIEAPASIIGLKDVNDQYVDVVKNDFVSQGKIYGLPLYVDSLALYYNKDILGTAGIATPPTTWAQLQADVKKITKLDNSGFFTKSGVAMGTTSNVNLAADIIYLLMLQNGTPAYTGDNSRSTIDQSVDKNGTTTFPAIDAVKYYTSFADPASPDYTWNAKSNYSIDAFANGQLAFLYGYSFTRATIMQKSPNLNFDVAPVPQVDLSQNAVNYSNYWGNVVSAQSKNSAWAWSFVKFMASKDQLTSYYTRHLLPSSRKDIIATQVSDPTIGVFASENLTAKSFYKKDSDQVDQIIINMIESVIQGRISVDQAVSNASEKINLLNNQN